MLYISIVIKKKHMKNLGLVLLSILSFIGVYFIIKGEAALWIHFEDTLNEMVTALLLCMMGIVSLGSIEYKNKI